MKGGEINLNKIPETPRKPFPYVSRLTEREDRIMRDYEDYDAEPVDLEEIGETPVGDVVPSGYGKIAMKKGKLGGKKKKRNTMKKRGKTMKKKGKKNRRKNTKKRNTNKRTTKKNVKKTLKIYNKKQNNKNKLNKR